MKYSIILFDADNTVLDFDAAEEQALKIAFDLCGAQVSSEILAVYRKINIAQWQKFERGEISIEEVLTSRFRLTLETLNLQLDLPLLSESYEKFLHMGFQIVPHAEEVLQQLIRIGCRLYIVSNGILSIQNARMKGSGLEKYFQKRFISGEIGVQKPQKEFFDAAFSQIENFSRKQTLIVGDSLSSDIRGGVNAGIDTCWFNPSHTANPTELIPTYQIDDLRQVVDIVKK